MKAYVDVHSGGGAGGVDVEGRVGPKSQILGDRFKWKALFYNLLIHHPPIAASLHV